jgi:hypothetical protein
VTSSGALELKQTVTQRFSTEELYAFPVTYDMVTTSGLFGDGLWHSAGFTMTGTSWSILFDGKLLRQATFPLSRTTDPGFRLFIGSKGDGTDSFLGDMDVIIYMGSNTALSFFNSLKPTYGEWLSPVIDLGNTYILDSLTNHGYISNDHNVSVEARLSDTRDFKHVLSTSFNLGEQFIPPDFYQNRILYPRQWVSGRYAQFNVSMNRGESNFSPNISNVVVNFLKMG